MASCGTISGRPDASRCRCRGCPAPRNSWRPIRRRCGSTGATPSTIGASRTKSGTLNAALASYYTSASFTDPINGFSPATRRHASDEPVSARRPSLWPPSNDRCRSRRKYRKYVRRLWSSGRSSPFRWITPSASSFPTEARLQSRCSANAVALTVSANPSTTRRLLARPAITAFAVGCATHFRSQLCRGGWPLARDAPRSIEFFLSSSARRRSHAIVHTCDNVGVLGERWFWPRRHQQIRVLNGLAVTKAVNNRLPDGGSRVLECELVARELKGSTGMAGTPLSIVMDMRLPAFTR